MLKRIGLIAVIVILLGSAGFTGWASQINPIMPSAVTALQSDAQVQVATGDWIVFQPAG